MSYGPRFVHDGAHADLPNAYKWSGVGVTTAGRIGARRVVELLGDWRTGESVYVDLAERIRLLVIDGRIPLGTRLPSERELAQALGRSRSTVVAAYDRLREGDYLRSRQGSGTIAWLPRVGDSGPSIDFAHALPPPIDGIEEAMRQALGHVERALDGPGFDMLGDSILRGRIADRYTGRGLPTTPDQVLVTVGGQHGIGMLARQLLRTGQRVLVETPTYPHAFEAFQRVSAQPVSTPVSRDGWDIEHLTRTLETQRPSLAYLVPDFHNPTGASMASAERRTVAAAAARAGTILVIDETTADLDIDRGWDDGPFARHAGATGASVISVGSLSKSVWGGLRLGWIRAESGTIEHLARGRPGFDLGTPRLEQLVACEVLPQFPELMKVRSAQLRERRDHLGAELTRHLPSWEAPSPPGGLSFWVGLGSASSSALALRSRDFGMAVSAGPQFAIDSSQERFFRLPFTLPPDELSAGVAALRMAWMSLEDPRNRAGWDFGVVV